MTNLVTLCHKCHDYVEMNEISSRAAIQGSLFDGIIIRHAEEKEPDTWQSWVYGGKRRKRVRKHILNAS